MTPAPEKAAPIPADVLALAEDCADRIADHSDYARRIIARAIMQDRADREARPSLPDSREERIREDKRAPDALEALGKLFWLELREPGLVPQRKGPWPHARTKEILREFMKVNPAAYISVVTISHDGPWFDDAPETLGIVDGRCWPTSRKHIETSSAAHAMLPAARARQGGNNG